MDNTENIEAHSESDPAAIREQVIEDIEANTPINFYATAAWLQAAGKVPGNQEHLSVQVGVAIEEIGEFLRSLSIESNTGITATALVEVTAHLDACASMLKRGVAKVVIHDREACLDALCDVEVTINGVGYLAGMNKPAADREVLLSNWSKFKEDGTPVILEGGKVGKNPSTYRPPNLDGLY